DAVGREQELVFRVKHWLSDYRLHRSSLMSCRRAHLVRETRVQRGVCWWLHTDRTQCVWHSHYRPKTQWLFEFGVKSRSRFKILSTVRRLRKQIAFEAVHSSGRLYLSNGLMNVVADIAFSLIDSTSRGILLLVVLSRLITYQAHDVFCSGCFGRRQRQA